ncbi:MAG: SIS domain-containing protein [Clostridia bacterium]|nr:SIS domain-containing protein [Clostridia bacterium]
MKEQTRKILSITVTDNPKLSFVEGDILAAFETMKSAYDCGGKLFVCGNGGSCSDSEHIVGELMKSFKKCRPIDEAVKTALLEMGEDGDRLANSLEGGLPAICLSSHPSLSTAFINDKDPYMCYAQQLSVLGKKGDVLVVLSTSGNAKNCLYAVITAKAMGIKTVLLAGKTGGSIKALADVSVVVPENETYRVQELHLPIYHCLCAMLEEEFF